MELRSIEVVEDHTAESSCDEGFLRLSRLTLKNVYADGTESEPYRCDVVTRPGSDAVVAALYRIEEGRVRVMLRESPRAPIYLRRLKRFEHPDPREYLSLVEVVAGLVEAGDGPGDPGLKRRASVEAEEEAGVHTRAEDFAVIGGETFATPGTSDEKVFYCAGPIDPAARSSPRGDGSVMEESGVLVERDLAEAIEACRTGEIPDMKTEIALLRLADHLGFIPQLDCFVGDLAPEIRERYRSLGVEPRDASP